MFNIGEYVACGNKGVCVVEGIKTLDISGVDKNEKYYIMKPVYNSASTVYIPVEFADGSVRPVLTAEEAKILVADIPNIECLEITSEKTVENMYKSCIRSNDVREFVRLIKTIYNRKQGRIAAGRKETAVDTKYFKIVADYLFGELAISLDVAKNEVEGLITASGWSK